MDVPLKVIKIDPQNKRIVLSVSAWLEGRSQQEVDEFRAKFPKRQIVEEPRPERTPGAEDRPSDSPDYELEEAFEDEAVEAAPEGSGQPGSGQESPGAPQGEGTDDSAAPAPEPGPESPDKG
jgi:hypothetical protein